MMSAADDVQTMTLPRKQRTTLFHFSKEIGKRISAKQNLSIAKATYAYSTRAHVHKFPRTNQIPELCSGKEMMAPSKYDSNRQQFKQQSAPCWSSGGQILFTPLGNSKVVEDVVGHRHKSYFQLY